MTDNEIVRSLRCCSTTTPCTRCKYKALVNCEMTLKRDAIVLINRLQEEIEMLKEENKKQKVIMEEMTDLMFPLPFETDYDKAIKTAKAEAIKEFAERVTELKKERVIISVEHIDNLVKEMVGDD